MKNDESFSNFKAQHRLDVLKLHPLPIEYQFKNSTLPYYRPYLYITFMTAHDLF